MKKTTHLVAAGLGLAQLLLLSGGTFAQERSASPLNEVVLVATRSPKKQTEIGKAVKVIGPEVLARSQGRTVYELLNQVAGLTLSGAGNAPGSVINLFMRGASRGNTLILIDGIPANNASDISGDYDISSISIDQLERIEILKGTNSTLYGSDAVAGVINLVTKHPSKDALKAGLLATGGTYGTFRQAAQLNGTFGQTGVALNVSNLTSDGFSAAKTPVSQAPFEKDGFAQRSLSAHLVQPFTDRFSVSANLQVNRNSFDLDNGAFSDDLDYTARNTSFFGGLDAKYTLKGGTLDLIYNQNNVRYRFDDPEGGADFSRQDNKGKISYAEAIFSKQLFSSLGMTGGVNYRYMETDQKFESQSMFGPYNSHLAYGDANNNISSVYSSFSVKKDGYDMELGGRFNHHSQYGNNVTYTLNQSYSTGEEKLYLSISSAFKAPSLYQLNSEYRNPAGLDPERTTSFEGGRVISVLPGKLSLDIAAFIRTTNNLIYFYTDPATFASQYRNGYRQEDKGLEAELTALLSSDLELSAWYAHVQGEGTTASGTNVNYLLRRPKNTWGANGVYRFHSKASLSLTYKFTGDRLDPYGFPASNLSQHAFSLLDAYVEVTPARKLTFFADVKNLFDEGYTEWQGYSTRGRNFNAGLKYGM